MNNLTKNSSKIGNTRIEFNVLKDYDNHFPHEITQIGSMKFLKSQKISDKVSSFVERQEKNDPQVFIGNLQTLPEV